LPNTDRCFEDRPDWNPAPQLVCRDRGQRHRRDASAGRAVGISSVLTRSDDRLQISRQRFQPSRRVLLTPLAVPDPPRRTPGQTLELSKPDIGPQSSPSARAASMK
jgi:hypothetical protein